MGRRIMSAIAFFMAFAFITIGYAAVTDNLSVNGSATVEGRPLPGIYIRSVSRVSSSGASNLACTFISPTSVETSVSANGSGSVTYKITVENTSEGTYWYRGTNVIKDLDGYNNSLVGSSGGINLTAKDKLSDSGATFDTNDWVPPLSTRDFYVTYSFGSKAKGTLKTLITFSFGAKMETYGDEFLAILNTPERYSTLVEAFNTTYAKNDATVLSNIGSDKAFLESLFGTELMLNGEPVTIVIERINVDERTTGDSYSPSGPTGCEYTIYLTTGDGKVHAVSYMFDSGLGKWRQIGELYEGTTSKTETYTDSQGNKMTVMDIDSWRASHKEYTFFSYKGRSATYIVGSPNVGETYDKYAEIKELMGANETGNNIDRKIYNGVQNMGFRDIMRNVWNILNQNKDSKAPEIVALREAFEGVAKYCHGNNPGEYILNESGWTRAELIAVFEKFQHALEYYDQVHG